MGVAEAIVLGFIVIAAVAAAVMALAAVIDFFFQLIEDFAKVL